MRPNALTGLLFLAIPFIVSAAQPPTKASASHTRGICGEIVKLDLLLYDRPSGHERTTVCSYTDDRLLIKPKTALPDERMRRFVFLAFVTVGSLRNDDYLLPEKTYVGFGTECQVLSTNDAATIQRMVRRPGDDGMMRAMIWTSQAPKVPCPK